jgi:hypothetical protein
MAPFYSISTLEDDKNQNKQKNDLTMTSGAACKAVCVLMSDSGNNVLGYLTIAQPDVNQPVKITGNLTGLTPGKHGISVCVSGDASLGASTCGAIFNPFGTYSHRIYGSLASLLDPGGSLVFYLVDFEYLSLSHYLSSQYPTSSTFLLLFQYTPQARPTEHQRMRTEW